MLDSLVGKLLEADETGAVIDVGGIRFRVEIPSSTARSLPAAGTVVELKTRLALNMNEGALMLFGFATPAEREVFDILNGITGIGPKRAVAILSKIEIAPFAQAVLRNDIGYLSGIKGIGKKTAERLIVELREKMAPYAAASAESKLPASSNVRDALQALIVLGCRPSVAERAVADAVAALGEKASTEALIKEGLKRR